MSRTSASAAHGSDGSGGLVVDPLDEALDRLLADLLEDLGGGRDAEGGLAAC